MFGDFHIWFEFFFLKMNVLIDIYSWKGWFKVFKHGGAPFLIPFFLMLFLVGIPTFFLETSLGQFTGLSPTEAFYNMAPIFQGSYFKY